MDSGVSRMEIMEGIKSLQADARDTRDKVIEVATRQEADKELHEQRWNDHNGKHDEIKKQLDKIQASTCGPKAHKTPDMYALAKYGLIAVILGIVLVYSLTGTKVPAIPGVTS